MSDFSIIVTARVGEPMSMNVLWDAVLAEVEAQGVGPASLSDLQVTIMPEDTQVALDASPGAAHLDLGESGLVAIRVTLGDAS